VVFLCLSLLGIFLLKNLVKKTMNCSNDYGFTLHIGGPLNLCVVDHGKEGIWPYIFSNKIPLLPWLMVPHKQVGM
jgi:hypothetical protein